jgi:hypothetical protein
MKKLEDEIKKQNIIDLDEESDYKVVYESTTPTIELNFTHIKRENITSMKQFREKIKHNLRRQESISKIDKKLRK